MTDKPTWIKEIQERVDALNSRNGDEINIEETIEIFNVLVKDRRLLLRAYKAAIKTIEEAPHPSACGIWEFSERSEKTEEWTFFYPCNCWKSKALNFDPTKEVN